jgi:hypothetical protein
LNGRASGEDPDDMIDAAIEAAYRRASAQIADEPSEAARAAILAQAGRVAEDRRARSALPDSRHELRPSLRARARLRRPRVMTTLFGGMAAALLAGLLVIPYLRSHQEPQPIADTATSTAPVAQTAPAARTARIARIAPSAPAEYAAPAAPEVAPQAPIVAPARAPSSDASTVTAQAATPMQGAPLLGARDALGHTALIRAVAADELATVDALLAAGADPNAADADGETPLQLALAMKAESIAVRLRAAGAH